MRIDAPTREQIPSLRALWQEAFGDTDAFLDAFFDTAFSPARSLCIPEDEAVSAALYYFDCFVDERKIAYLYAVATAASRRGRGLCRSLMNETHERLKSLGYAAAVLVPGEGSLFGFYKNIGYRPFGGIQELSAKASGSEIPLYEISTDEYASLRRLYLPPHGIVQEGENLAFLKRQSVLYKGDGFLLAASQNGDSLRGIELLGDASAAPRILHTLGCKEGMFRTVGEDPFAMILPLTEDAPMPGYFGLAFD